MFDGIFDDNSRHETVEGYSKKGGRELHYKKNRVTRSEVLKDKQSLRKGWWKMRETKGEYILEMNPPGSEEQRRIRKHKDPFDFSFDNLF